MRGLFILCLALPLNAQSPSNTGRTAEGSPLDLELGQKLYTGRCGHCHGQNGEGGRGAVLNSGTFRHGGSDRELFQVIRWGIPGTEMPGAFSLPEADVWRMVRHVKQLATRGEVEPAQGDRAAGAAVYRKNGCASCHTVAGAGGLFGPDLTGIGAKRSARHLRESIVNPSVDVALDYRPVTVVALDGTVTRGIHLNEDEYSIHLRDLNGVLISLRKAELKDVRLRRESLMPAYPSIPVRDLDDLVAYLSSLRPAR